jgi:hypothetical protein
MSEGSRLSKPTPRTMAAPHFCNVDLEIESRSDLKILEAELGRKVVVLHGGPVKRGCFLLRLETGTEYDNPDDTICAFCACLEALSPSGRRAWRSAYKKVFDVGYDVVPSQLASQFSLRTETLKRISNLGAALGVTFYNHLKDERKTPVGGRSHPGN